MTKPTSECAVSVIIPTYNRSQLLEYTLHSLLTQQMSKDDYEVIVADDGSGDDTQEVAARYGERMRVKYVFQEDQGYRPASARNGGIRAAAGDICLFIDSSVLLHPGCLAEHVRFHAAQEAPRAAIGYVYGFDHDEDSEELLKKLVLPYDPEMSIRRLAQYPVFRDIREAHYHRYNDRIDNLPAPWFFFWTCHLSVKTDALFRVGLFDEGYDGRWGAEDNDLGFRLCRDGVRICLLRAAASIHFPHGKDKAEKQREGYQNCQYFHRKFNTPETRLFLDHYVSKSLVDINQLSVQMQQQAR